MGKEKEGVKENVGLRRSKKFLFSYELVAAAVMSQLVSGGGEARRRYVGMYVGSWQPGSIINILSVTTMKVSILSNSSSNSSQ